MMSNDVQWEAQMPLAPLIEDPCMLKGVPLSTGIARGTSFHLAMEYGHEQLLLQDPNLLSFVTQRIREGAVAAEAAVAEVVGQLGEAFCDDRRRAPGRARGGEEDGFVGPT